MMEDEPDKTLGQKLAAQRKKFGWSQSDLGRFLEMDQASVSRIERDSDEVSLIARRVAKDFLKMTEIGIVREYDLPPIADPKEGAPE